jgi:MinD-like ATPase involved in chromosome partitioning or flagellar assembly
MKTFIISNQLALIDEIQEIEGMTSVQSINLSDDLQVTKDDLIILSDDKAELTDVTQLRVMFPETTIFYVLSIQEDLIEAKKIQSMCKAHSIKVILPFRSIKQIVEEINTALFSSQKVTSHVVTGMAAIYGVGLTSTLLMLGRQITQVSDIRVGVLGLNGFNPGVSSIDYKGKYLDEIWGSLDGSYLRANDLYDKMDEVAPNLRYLAGNRDFIKIYTYTPEGISYLIELAKQKFDLVLIDAGHYIDTPLAVQGILSSDFLLVQTNQRQLAKDNWNRLKEQILVREIGLDLENAKNVWMICNMMYSTPDVETYTQLQEEYKLPCMANLAYYNSFYRTEYRKNLFEFQEKKYIEEINRVADALIDYYTFPLKELDKTAPKRRFFKFGGKG